MRMYVIRHGESELNAGVSKAVDCALTDVGRQQVRALAKFLAPLGVTHVLSSPYRRCLETAEAIRTAIGAAAEVCPALHEHHHGPFSPGDWPLAARAGVERAFPEFAIPADMPQTHWATVPEDRAHQWQRMTRVLRELEARFGRQRLAGVAVVTHQAPASVLIQAFCQWHNPLNVRVHVDPGSVTVLDIDADGRRHVRGLNWQPPAR